jgi:hypothetical protein
MPKVSTEPLYNHGSRPTASRQINVSTAPAGRRNISLVSNLILTPSTSQSHHHDNDYYPVPMDVDDEIDMPDAVNNPEDPQEEAVEALPGIKVLPKVKAKRYENSVSLALLVLLMTDNNW